MRISRAMSWLAALGGVAAVAGVGVVSCTPKSRAYHASPESTMTRSMATAVDAPASLPAPAPVVAGVYTYDPTNGTVSQGDLWRVKNGSPTAPLYWVSAENAAMYSGDRYSRVDEAPFKLVTASPLSTFSIDVDTASYANVRRFLKEGQLPEAGAVRIEELVNYFPYAYPKPEGGDPFSVTVEIAECPWELQHRLVRIGLHGEEVDLSERLASNLVFLLDVSGSMSEPDKLPLLKQSLRMLTEQLEERDTISIVVYAGNSGLVLPPTRGDNRRAILDAIDRLESGGSTNGGAGIELAYATAREGFIEGGVNRVILGTDGDFNVGTTSNDALVGLIEKERESGVFLSVLGFGRGNLNDSMMEALSNKGNGNYAYIDSEREARKVLVEQMSGTLITIAQDVKIQVEFNPDQVQAYRLVGYENRSLANEDFNDDRKDAGEIGAGHTVTAFYEVIPAGLELELPNVDPLKYQITSAATGSDELLTVKLRYKEPEGDTSKLIEVPAVDAGKGLAEASDDFIFSASVASFGMLLRESQYQGLLTMGGVEELAESARGKDPNGHRGEFVELVRKAEELREMGK